MKRVLNGKLVILPVMFGLIVGIAGCGQNSDKAGSVVADKDVTIVSMETTLQEETTVEITTEAPTEPPIDTSKYIGINHPKPVLDNIIYDDLSILDRTKFGTGNGPAADEYGRPYSALNNMTNFAKYQAYYVRDDITEKKIFLTMDEGYEYGCTERILDVLKEKDVKVTFFVTLPYAQSRPDLVQRMIDEGHVLGNHSVSHQSFPSLGVETQKQEIIGVHEYILENFGYDMYLFRYPMGEYNEQSLAIVNNLGYASIFWSFAYKDYDVKNQPDENEAFEKVMSKLHSGAIYLLHAESTTNTNILGRFIDAARAEGYTFELFEPVQENSLR